jgi:hypothetical protein
MRGQGNHSPYLRVCEGFSCNVSSVYAVTPHDNGAITRANNVITRVQHARVTTRRVRVVCDRYARMQRVQVHL